MTRRHSKRSSHAEGAEQITVDSTRHRETIIVLILADGVTGPGPDVAIDRATIVTPVLERDLHVNFNRTIVSIVIVVGTVVLVAYAWIHSNRRGLYYCKSSAAHVTIPVMVVVMAPVPFRAAMFVASLAPIALMLLLLPMVMVVIVITEQKPVHFFMGKFGPGGYRRRHAQRAGHGDGERNIESAGKH